MAPDQKHYGILGHEQNFPKQTMDPELDQPLPIIMK
jgi:hypothetical protein